MSTPATVEIEPLLAPIPGDSPVGNDPRLDTNINSAYQKAKDSLNHALANERRISQNDPDAEAPDWRPLLKLCPEILTKQAKDLQVCAWFIQALVREHSFPGLRDGLKLTHQIAMTFWDDGPFPHPDEDDPDEDPIEVLLYGLDQLNDLLPQTINSLPLTRSDEGDFSRNDRTMAFELAKVADPKIRNKRIEAGAITLDQFDKSVAKTPPQHFQALRDDVQECFDELLRYEQAFGEKCGTKAPSSSSLRETLATLLEEVKGFVKTTGGDKPAPGEALPEDEAGGTDEAGGEAGGGGGGGGRGFSIGVGSIRDRDQAFDVILRIADFLETTEPHSLVPHSLRQAVHWGKMPLPELLKEVIEDKGALQGLFKRVGITEGEGS